MLLMILWGSSGKAFVHAYSLGGVIVRYLCLISSLVGSVTIFRLLYMFIFCESFDFNLIRECGLYIQFCSNVQP